MSEEIEGLRAEVEAIRSARDRTAAEVAELKAAQKRELARRYDERLDMRKLPPMAQMTRIQKRYFLEPWMTTFTLISAAVAIAAFTFALFTPLHAEFGLLGALFLLVSGAFLITKLSLMDWNSKTESQLVAQERDRRYR